MTALQEKIGISLRNETVCLLFVVALISIVSCARITPTPESTPTIDQELLETQVAATVFSQLTVTAKIQVTGTPPLPATTQTSLVAATLPTSTLPKPVPTSRPSATANTAEQTTPTFSASLSPTTLAGKFPYPAPQIIQKSGNAIWGGARGWVITWDFPSQLADDEWFQVSGGAWDGSIRRTLAWTKDRSFTLRVQNSDIPSWLNEVSCVEPGCLVNVYVTVVRGKDGKWQGDQSPSSAPLVFYR